MKRLLLVTMLLALLAGSPCTAQETNPVTDTPVRLQSVRADFVQLKHLKILARPIVSRGTFAYQQPQSLRWEYVEPVRSILLLHHGSVRKFVERDGQMQEDRGMQVGSLHVVLAEISNWLGGRFIDNPMFEVSVVDDETIRFSPRDQNLAALISFIEIKVADDQGLLDSVLISEGPDSSTKMTFDNRILNRELPLSLFTDP